MMDWLKNMLLVLTILFIGQDCLSQCDKVYTKAETVPEFEGGSAAWKRFLERELWLDTTFEIQGRYCVTLRFEFMVDTNGHISDLRFLDTGNKKIDYFSDFKSKLEKTRWTPAILNGRKVCYKKIQTIQTIIQ